MAFFHAVLKIDRSAAKIDHLGGDQVQVATLVENAMHTAQHHSGVRTAHTFLGAVCDALAGAAEVLVVGSRGGQGDLRRYIDKHRPAVAGQIVAWKTVNHPTEAQLIALGRQFFAEHEREAGSPPAV